MDGSTSSVISSADSRQACKVRSGKISWADLTDAEFKTSKMSWADISDDVLEHSPAVAPFADTDTASTEASSPWACIDHSFSSGDEASDTDQQGFAFSADSQSQLSDCEEPGLASEMQGRSTAGDWSQRGIEPLGESGVFGWWPTHDYHGQFPVEALGEHGRTDGTRWEAVESAHTPLEKAHAKALAAARAHQRAVSQSAWTYTWWHGDDVDSFSCRHATYTQNLSTTDPRQQVRVAAALCPGLERAAEQYYPSHLFFRQG